MVHGGLTFGAWYQLMVHHVHMVHQLMVPRALYWNERHFYKYNLKFRKYFKDICKQPHPMAKPGCESAPAASLAHVLLLAKRDDSTQLQLCHSSSSVARVKTLENT